MRFKHRNVYTNLSTLVAAYDSWSSSVKHDSRLEQRRRRQRDNKVDGERRKLATENNNNKNNHDIDFGVPCFRLQRVQRLVTSVAQGDIKEVRRRLEVGEQGDGRSNI